MKTEIKITRITSDCLEIVPKTDWDNHAGKMLNIQPEGIFMVEEIAGSATIRYYYYLVSGMSLTLT